MKRSRSDERERSREEKESSRNNGGHHHAHQHRDRDEGTRSHESLDVYWKAVRDDQQNFDAWTKLITAAEQFDDLRAGREVYDTFLLRYPYCFGYWRKYAEMERRHFRLDRCNEVYQRGVSAIPLSVELWLSYLALFKDQYIKKDDPERDQKIRQLYDRAIDAAGYDFRSDRLWEDYINWELTYGNRRNAIRIYDRVLSIPTLMYSQHFDNLQTLVNKYSPDEIVPEEEYEALLKEIENTLQAKKIEVFTVEEFPVEGSGLRGEDYNLKEKITKSENDKLSKYNETESENTTTSANGELITSAGDEIKTEYRKRFSDEALKLCRLKILDRRRRVHLSTEQEVSRRWAFEDGIKRPYFHVKPLERAQLKNWRNYLDFEIAQGDRHRIGVLFERSLIACAMYEDIWIKYARYMEPIDPQTAKEVYQRACYTHLPKKPNPRLAWAAFEEHRGNIEEARRILKEFATDNPGYLMIEMRRLGLERRRILAKAANRAAGADADEDGAALTSEEFAEVSKIYESKIRDRSTKPKVATFYAVKYARFLAKIRGDRKLAEKVLLRALEDDEKNPKLYLQLIELAFYGFPLEISTVVEAFDRALKSNLPQIEKVKFSQRKLEFLEDLGADIREIQDHYEWHQKLCKLAGISATSGVSSESKKRKPSEEKNEAATSPKKIAIEAAVAVNDETGAAPPAPNMALSPTGQMTMERPTGSIGPSGLERPTHVVNSYGIVYYPPPYKK